MTAFQLGPFVLSAPRFYAALGLIVLVVAAEAVVWLRRRGERRAAARLAVSAAVAAGGGRDFAASAPGTAARVNAGSRTAVPDSAAPDTRPSANWAWNAAFAALIAARLGYVVENFSLFLAQPLAILQFWQGGFSPWWGVGAGLIAAAWAVRGKSTSLDLVVLPAILALGTWLVVPAMFSPAQVVDRNLPSLTLERLEGGELDLASLTGQPVVVNLWATWCPPCRRELPMLASAARTYPDVHFVFADQAESRATVEDYLSERDDLQLSGVVLDTSGRLASEFGSIGLPTTLFFDAEGMHVLTHAGELSSVMMVNYLADLRRGEL